MCRGTQKARRHLATARPTPSVLATPAEHVEDSTPGSCHVRFTVEDTGIGISQDRLDRLFQSFSQVDASTTRKYGGTGLGLAISKQLCELMGGTIGVDSELGRGSTFWFTIPFQASAVPPQDRRMPDVDRILIVDSSPRTSEVLAQQLAAWGVRAQYTQDLTRALGLLESSQTGPAWTVLVSHALLEEAIREYGVPLRELLPEPVTKLIGLVPLHQQLDSAGRARLGVDNVLTRPILQSELCRALTAEEPATCGGQRPEQRSDERQQSLRARRAPFRLLLAEDNKTNQAMASAILARSGFACDAVENGTQAVAAVRQGLYHLVLMDCQMPLMDGFEATRIIRQQESEAGRAGALPIIALTASALKGDRENCLAAGMTDYLTKPLVPEKLIGIIDRYLAIDSADAPSDESLPAEPPHAPPAGCFDRSALLHRCLGEADLAEEVLADFRQRAPRLIDGLEESVRLRDCSALAAQAHHFKGGAANVSALQLEAAAVRLEASAHAGDLAAADASLERLRQEWDQFQSVLQTELECAPA